LVFGTLARRGIVRVLANEKDFSIVAEAANGIEAISTIEKFSPI
jgi:YesN/AraC family two-component response regulator